MKHLLFADAPGEWFKLWAVNRDSPGCEGARWLSENADMFLVLADQGSLAGEDRGVARITAQTLIRRVSSEHGTRPVCLVWTKSDVEISPEIRSSVVSAGGAIEDLHQLSVSVYPENDRGRCFIRILDWCLNRSVRNSTVTIPKVQMRGDVFFMYGGRT